MTLKSDPKRLVSPIPNGPPGWSSNPSAWPERRLSAGLALVGLGVASYLALDQLGALNSVWEPFFGSGSERVLHSWFSRLTPLPDAALGAVGYLIELAAILWGGTDRWKSKPWAVLILGLTAGLMALTSVILAMLQPLAFHAWCTLCLVSAAISLMIVGPAMKESLATLQYLRNATRAGLSLRSAILGRVPDRDSANPRRASSSSAATSENELAHSGANPS